MAFRFNWVTGKWDLQGNTAAAAPVDATYVVITNDPTLTMERALAVDNRLVMIDNGANSTVVLYVSDLYDPLLTMGG